SIRKSKTKAGVRTIAVAHPIAVGVLERRHTAGAPPSALLFPELVPGGYDKKHSWNVTKVYGRYRTPRRLTKATDFHSFRRTLTTVMENTPGLDQVKIARYVGHNLGTMAFSVYSGGSTEQTQIEVAKAIKYGKAIEAAVEGFLQRSQKATAERVQRAVM